MGAASRAAPTAPQRGQIVLPWFVQVSAGQQGFEVELCHGGVEALNALGVISDGSRRRRGEIE
jgi:hypothetical protein